MMSRFLILLFVPPAIVSLLLNIACMLAGFGEGAFPSPVLHIPMIIGGVLLLKWRPVISSVPIIIIGWLLPGLMYSSEAILMYFWLFFGLMLVTSVGSMLAALFYLFQRRASISDPIGRFLATFAAPVIAFALLLGFIFLVMRRGI